MKITRALKDRANDDGKGIFSIVTDTRYHKNQGIGSASHEAVSGLFYFALLLHKGLGPEQAFAAVDWATGGFDKAEYDKHFARSIVATA